MFIFFYLGQSAFQQQPFPSHKAFSSNKWINCEIISDIFSSAFSCFIISILILISGFLMQLSVRLVPSTKLTRIWIEISPFSGDYLSAAIFLKSYLINALSSWCRWPVCFKNQKNIIHIMVKQFSEVKLIWYPWLFSQTELEFHQRTKTTLSVG